MSNINPTIAAYMAWFTPPPAKPAKHPGWKIVSEALAGPSRYCEECKYMHHEVERVPYGEGTAPMGVSECVLGDRPGESPEDCPAYQAHLQSLADDPTEEAEVQP